ncbi:MAG: cobalamin biosynthesis protein [Clostridiales bacterium]|nr:cobalamin biosynthesis protein [Clostridiales bacterium]
MKEQISILSFTEQGFRIAKQIQTVLSADGCVWLAGWMKNVRQGMETSRSDGQNTSVSEVQIILYTKNRQIQCRESVFVTGSLHSWCEEIFVKSAAVIFIGAVGIAVRTIAPFLRSKTEDPAVLAVDECGQHIISLLSGHLGGGNAMTIFLAEKMGADPVITTASDVGGKIAIDVWAQKNDLFITDQRAAKRIASRIVNGETLPFYCEGRIRGEIPPELMLTEHIHRCESPGGREIVPQNVRTCESEKPADGRIASPGSQNGSHTGYESEISAENVIVSVRDVISGCDDRQSLHLVPRAVVLGMGCKKGKSFAEIWDFVYCLLKKHRISPKSICALTSIDLKAEEPGLKRLAEELGAPFVTFSAETLREVPGTYSPSPFVYETTGVNNVCERAAMAFLTEAEQKNARFLCRKISENGMTAALLEKPWTVFFEQDGVV